MNQDCVFCRISEGKNPARLVYESEDIIAFHDINPQAPVHLLIIPRRHFTNLLNVNEQDSTILAKMLFVATEIAKQTKIAETGFRIVINTNRNAGQSVDHLHIHVLGGRIMEWPPG
ncbi:MAG TPA: histidine triad nucleotide-binding protein [bacterium]|nr:histidine triad nucleotide-binding protein [bacterium]HOL49527.1 histidine triad nucleotide-binding protein [bacterium]HPO51266.1 histidine triad nucleotide-binding protein [bacterium]HXK45653.1 histidine triad nucleotide-binding protein [bacterium]